MTEPTNTIRTQLPLASAGCSCCAPTAPGAAPATEPQGLAGATISRTYPVEGMTCGHCAGQVTGALTALEDVAEVRVELVPGGTSAVVVTGSADPQAVRAAVEEAGYALTES